MTAASNYPLSVEFLADGKFVTAGSHNGRVRIWDRESGGIFQTLEHDSKPIQIRMSHEGLRHVRRSACKMHCSKWIAHSAFSLTVLTLIRLALLVIQSSLQLQVHKGSHISNSGLRARVSIFSLHFVSTYFFQSVISVCRSS